MVLALKELMLPLKDPVPVNEPSVVVAMTVASVELVPYAKPCCVAFAPPLFVIEPKSVAAVGVGALAELVVTVGATTTNGV